MNDNQIRKIMAVGLTAIVVILLSILNLLAPMVGSIIIMAIGVIWVSAVVVIYGEE